jgi:hypothetical protein
VPIPARLAAAALSASGCVVTNDIGLPFDRCQLRLTISVEQHAAARWRVNTARLQVNHIESAAH